MDIEHIQLHGQQGSFHSGIDLVGNTGSHALCGETFYTFYAHMRNNSICVSVGQQVSEGQILGTQGSTGNSTGDHVHFEIRKADKSKLDPAPYLLVKHRR